MSATATTETVSETRVTLELDWDTACALRALAAHVAGSSEPGNTRHYTEQVSGALDAVGVGYEDYSRFRFDGDALQSGRAPMPEGSPCGGDNCCGGQECAL